MNVGPDEFIVFGTIPFLLKVNYLLKALPSRRQCNWQLVLTILGAGEKGLQRLPELGIIESAGTKPWPKLPLFLHEQKIRPAPELNAIPRVTYDIIKINEA